MSGPNSDEPVVLTPYEVHDLLEIYRAHRRPIDGECSCGNLGCRWGAEARGKLWMGGINPEHYRETAQ